MNTPSPKDNYPRDANGRPLFDRRRKPFGSALKKGADDQPAADYPRDANGRPLFDRAGRSFGSACKTSPFKPRFPPEASEKDLDDA